MTTNLKSLLETTASTVAARPAAAAVAFSTVSELVGVCEVDVEIRDHTVKVDEPEALGGSNVAPNPVELALAALGSCQAITYRFWSEKLGIRIDGVKVQVRGDLDIHGVFGLKAGVRPGFSNVTVDVELRGPERPERYAELRRAVDEHCPVLDIFAAPVPVHTAQSVLGVTPALG